jgi:hypothetical protein
VSGPARQAPYEINAGILAGAAELSEQTNRVATDLDLLAEEENAKLAAPAPAPAPPAQEEGPVDSIGQFLHCHCCDEPGLWL